MLGFQSGDLGSNPSRLIPDLKFSRKVCSSGNDQRLSAAETATLVRGVEIATASIMDLTAEVPQLLETAVATVLTVELYYL